VKRDHPAIRWAFLEGYKACCGGEGRGAEVALEEWFAGTNEGAEL